MPKALLRPAAALSLAAAALGPCAAQAAVTTYQVTQTYDQVVYNNTHPSWDTVFTGTFQYDDVAHTVSNLQGTLTQAMTGNTASRTLSFQRASTYDATLGGLRVSTFLLDSTDVFQGGGYATGGMKEFGNQNAYVTVFVPTAALTAALTPDQTDALAYGDCTPGSLMGMGMGAKTCMTGWVNHTKANLAGGTMQGTYPITQTISAVPEPRAALLMLLGLPLLALRRRAGRD